MRSRKLMEVDVKELKWTGALSLGSFWRAYGVCAGVLGILFQPNRFRRGTAEGLACMMPDVLTGVLFKDLPEGESSFSEASQIFLAEPGCSWKLTKVTAAPLTSKRTRFFFEDCFLRTHHVFRAVLHDYTCDTFG